MSIKNKVSTREPQKSNSTVEYDLRTTALDVPTKAAHLGWRCVLTFITWVVLGWKINSGFFTSLFLFSAPLILDYIKFSPDTLYRTCLKWFGVALSIILAVASLFGLIGIFGIIPVNEVLFVEVAHDFITLKGQLLPVESIWLYIGIIVVCTILDWLAYDSPFESSVIEDYKTNTDTYLGSK